MSPYAHMPLDERIRVIAREELNRPLDPVAVEARVWEIQAERRTFFQGCQQRALTGAADGR